MEQLKDFIKFIEENPPSEDSWFKTEWTKALDLWDRDWRKITRRFYNDAEAWSCVEEARPKKSYDYLCRVLLQTIGIKLALEWSNSSDSDQLSAAEEMCRDRLDLWADFNATIKNMILTKLFSRHTSTSEDYLRDLTFSLRHLDRSDRDLRRSIIDKFPRLPECPGYVTPPEIENLLDFVCKAGDKEYEDKIRRRIQERKVAFGGMSRNLWRLRPNMGQRIPCNPNENERELIARLLKIPAANGYKRSALPEILLSSETPPIFVSQPKLEEADNYENISIEELLGVYRPRQEQILIWEKGIQWLARRNRNFDEEWLFAVVLIHELGHWITHTLPKPGSPFWETSNYMLAEEDVHEGWAQLMTSWVADRAGGDFKQTFDDLNKIQSAKYQVFKKYVHEPPDKMMSSLEKLRSLPWPARLQDWEEIIKS